MASPVRPLFDAFHGAEDAASVLRSGAALVAAAPDRAAPALDPDAFFAWLAPALTFKQRAYVDVVAGRWRRAAAWRAPLHAGARAGADEDGGAVVISGAGPCGLRAACEAALVMPRAPGRGLQVHLVELRTECTRHNVLKMWQPTFDDLVAWGLLACTPLTQLQQRRHGHLHVATRALQICLLKAAVLLGVHIHWGRGLCGLVPPADGTAGWRAWTLPSDHARRFLRDAARSFDDEDNDGGGGPSDGGDSNGAGGVFKLGGEKDVSRLQQVSRVDYLERATSERGALLPPPPPPPSQPGATRPSEPVWPYEVVAAADVQEFLPLDVLVVAEGEASRLIRRLGFNRHVMRYGEAIGIIVNVDASGPASTPAERNLPEFVVQRMSATWRDSCLGPLAEAGIDLENLEYMRGAGTHFIAATTKTAVLQRLGVVRERFPTTRATLAPTNVDQDALRRLARAVATAVGIPAASPLCQHHGVQLFDYSCKGVCTEPMRWIGAPDPALRRLPVLPVGDALQNPFWPQGLGVNRGFHTAIDAVWMAYERVAVDDSTAEQERAHAFRTMQWQTFAPTLLQPGAQWEVDPLTRYAHTIQRSMHMHDIEQRAAHSSVPPRYRTACALSWPPA